MDSHEIWVAAQLLPGEGIEDGVGRIELLMEECVRDAERFRKLCHLFQQAYDGDTFESEMLDVYCLMQSQWRGERTIQADLRWNDKSDEPLDLGSALDAA